MTVKVIIPERDLKLLNDKLARLTMFHQSSVLLAGMRSAGRAVRNRAKELAPSSNREAAGLAGMAPGILSDSVMASLMKATLSERGRAGGKASLKTDQAYKIKAFVRRNEPVLEVRVKAAKPAPHLHLVELGHDIVKGGTVPRKQGGKTPQAIDPSKTGKGRVVGRVAGRPFLSRGGKYSEPQQRAEMNKAIVRAIKKLLGG